MTLLVVQRVGRKLSHHGASPESPGREWQTRAR